MYDFLRDNFKMVTTQTSEGENKPAFEYVNREGKICITDLEFFLNNSDLYIPLIDFWEEQGLKPPQ